MSERNERAVEPINPFARRPTGVGLTFRERMGVLAIYLGLALFLGQHLVRSSASSKSIAVGASSASQWVAPSPGTIVPSPPLAVGSRSRR
jgi:hypothetical protein